MADIKELVIVSGKGGTGKTSLAGALASLFQNKIIADCDVDAANLHIILTPEEVLSQKEFTGGKKANINLNRCTQCGVCRDICRYDAISEEFTVDPVSCEGCGACFFLCPVRAIDFTPQLAGHCYICSTSSNDCFVFAELLPGEENSGKLVAMVRNEAREEAKKEDVRLILIDGPPGIGCPVISSLTGTHLALIVTEPTPTGIHDLKRIVDLALHFKIKVALVVNKSDINPQYVTEIRQYCETQGLAYSGEIPYEVKITEAQKEMKTILDFAPECEASRAIREIHKKIQSILEEI
ncbi:MAG TPA: (4Fe-4S)-binding protein [Deltaproteobacteria bacterium]|nr:(4Fe-4S)-binding protein [Deltaproteobacteria bacterium]